MQDISRRNLLRFAAVAPLAGTLSTTKVVSSNARKLDPVDEHARERIQELHLPNVPLVSHEGDRVLFYDDLIKDKIVTINFFYSKCDKICPLVMTNLVKVQKILGDQVGRQLHMYSITLKPDQDDVGALREYRSSLHARPGWTFFTGKTADIDKVRRGIGFTYPDPALDRDVTNHIGNVRYGNEPLMLWAACPGQAHAEWVAESFEWMVHPETNRVQKP
jgi:protein SCO1/2